MLSDAVKFKKLRAADDEEMVSGEINLNQEHHAILNIAIIFIFFCSRTRKMTHLIRTVFFVVS
jgi:hypothetical protein